MGYIEKRMAQLPGMDGLDACTRWAAKIQPMLPETRATSIPLPRCARRAPIAARSSARRSSTAGRGVQNA